MSSREELAEIAYTQRVEGDTYEAPIVILRKEGGAWKCTRCDWAPILDNGTYSVADQAQLHFRSQHTVMRKGLVTAETL